MIPFPFVSTIVLEKPSLGFRRFSRKIRIPGRNGEGTPRTRLSADSLGFVS